MKVNFAKALRVRTFKNLFLTIIGTMILALGASISSMAIIIEKLLNHPFFTVESIITILAWSLFLVGLFTLGRDFALKTLVSTLVYPLFISLFTRLISSPFLGGFFNLKNSPHHEISIILASLFGGVLVGTGCAITFLGGGSTGGIDIIAFLLCKHIKGLKSSKAIFYIDTVTIIFGIFVIKDLIITLLGIIAAFISAMVIDKIFISRSKALIAQIISDKYKEISEEIIKTLNRTTTHINITGGYTKEAKTMLVVTFGIRQYADLFNIINTIDNNAFVTVQQASEINGKGWTK